MPSVAVYALDVGVYTLGADAQPLTQGTSTGWCRLVSDDAASPNAVLYNTNRKQFEAGGNNLGCGRSVAALAETILDDVKHGRPVALGLEAPMWFPLHADHSARLRMFEHRFAAEQVGSHPITRGSGGSGYEWYLQAGAAAMLKAIGLGRMLFGLLATGGVGLDFTTQTEPVNVKPGAITLFEAFVAGDFKVKEPDGTPSGRLHEWDAFTAALGYGHVFHGMDVPPSWHPRRLYPEGRRESREIFSVWNAALEVSGLPRASGPPDCDVVGIAVAGRSE